MFIYSIYIPSPIIKVKVLCILPHDIRSEERRVGKECSPNKLTPLYSKIYYKEENYLKVKTAVFKYITPPYSKG